MTADSPRRFTFAELIDRGVLQLSDGYRAKNEELGGTGPLFLRAGHVTDSHIDFSGVERFHAELADRVAPKMSHPGDVVITTKGNSTGRVTFVTHNMPPFVYSPHLSYWRSLQADTLVPGFLRYWSRSREFREQLRGLSASTDMAPYLSLIDQRRLRITLPSPRHQRAIAGVLGTLDDKIELNRRMNETLEGIARAIFRSWFVDFDPVRAKAEGRDPCLPKPLADFFPKDFEESPLGPIPRSWNVLSLDEMARFLNGLALQKYPPSGGGSLPVIKIAQLRAGHTGGADLASDNIPPDYIVEDGDILFSWSGSLECAYWAGGRGALNQHLFKVTSSTHPKWLCYLAVHQHLDSFRHIAAGKATTMGHIQRHHLTQAKVLVPPTPTLQAMTGVLSPILESTWQRSVQSRTLAAIRDALLPKLLSGEIRINHSDEVF